MKTSAKKVKRLPAKRRDEVMEAFDNGTILDGYLASGVKPVVIRKVTTSINLRAELVEKLRKKAAKRGIGYQTMLKIIVSEHIDEY